MGQATIKVDVAPLYERPTSDSARTDEALYGMSVQQVEETQQGWSYIRTEHGTEGYTPTACLFTNVEVALAWKKYPKMTVLAPYIDVQRGADFSEGRVASVPRGGLLVGLGKPTPTGWQKVGLIDGSTGYTRPSYLGTTISDWHQMSEEDMRWNIVESALAYNGVAYRRGGRTPLGIDDTGLAAMAYMLNGVLIGQEAYIKKGLALHAIPRHELDEGDVLYFSDSVGIYIGRGEFVHSSTAIGEEGVVVSSLNPQDDHYREDLAQHIVSIGSIF